MAQQNSSNQKYNNNADGWDLTGGTTPRKLTTIGADIILTGSGTNVYTFPASTSTIASLALTETLTNKTLTSPLISSSTSGAIGSIERDTNVFYGTPVSGSKGVLSTTMYSIVSAADFTLATASGVQSCFASTGDVWTLAGSTTYIIEGHYFITKTTGNITTALAFALAGGASVTSIRYYATSTNAAANSTSTASNITEIDTVSSTIVNASNTTAVAIYFKGIIRMNAAGTVTPQINFSATATAPVMKAGSYIMFTPIGNDTTNILGNVA